MGGLLLTAEGRRGPRGAPEGSVTHTPCVAVGRFAPVKRLDRLIVATAIVRSYLPDVRLVLLGDGPERHRLERLIQRHGMEEVVTITGWLPPGEVAAWYERAHLVALASRSEGFPWSALEAMAHGVAVLAPRVGGLPELIVDGPPARRTGFLVNSGRVPDLVSGLNRALRGSGARERLHTIGRRARLRVLERFSRARELAQVGDVYRKALSKRET